ncbi:MAG TPA: glycosyltransferase family 39 protein [Planctomycetota bacterium]|nr:glycosyltransferase family 39 protein [Planctomycetota bacterium]
MDAESRRRWVPWIAAATAILTAARYVPIAAEPLDASLASMNTSLTAKIVRCWQEVGFFRLHGIPQFGLLPTDPPEMVPYLRHPPCYPWLVNVAVSAVGLDEVGMRIVPIAFACLAGGLLAAFAGRLAGARAAAAAGAVYLVSPMGLFFGWMANPESAVLAAILLTALLHETFRDGPPRRYAWVLGAFFAGTLLDWPAYFAAPALLVRELLEPRATRRLSRVIALFVAGAASFAAMLALFTVWSGSFDLAKRGLRGSEWFSTEQNLVVWKEADWFRNQVRFWSEFFSPPVAIVAWGSLPFLLRAAVRGDALARAALSLLVPAVLNVALFRLHAYEHPFWWYFGIPYAALACVWVARAFERRRALALAILAACVAWSVVRIVELRREYANSDRPRLAAELNQFAGARDGITTPTDFYSETFYLRAWPLPPIGDAGILRRLAEEKRQGRLLVDRVVCLVPQNPQGIPGLDFSALVKELPSIGTVRRLDRDELKRVAPHYGEIIGWTPLWILTIP